MMFSLYGTPAESMTYKMVLKDRETFGKIPKVTDKDYYTNSFHINVSTKINAI